MSAERNLSGALAKMVPYGGALGLALGLLFWVFDATVIDPWFFNADAVRSLTQPGPRDLWMRLAVIALSSAFGTGLSLTATRTLDKDREAVKRLDEELRAKIEQRDAAEKELRKLTRAVEQSSALIWMTDRNGTIEYVNPRFVETTGYGRDEIIGANSRILKSGKTPPEKYVEMWETILSGNTWQGELYNRKKSGELYCQSMSISPVKNEQGAVTHFIAVSDDVTEKKRMEEERESMQKQLLHSDKMASLGEIAAGIAHELNTPLNVILGYMEFLFKKLSPSDPHREYVQISLEEVQRCRLLMSDFMTYAHPSPVPEDSRESVDLKEMIQGVVRLIHVYHSPNVMVKTDLPPGLPPVKGRKKELMQVFINLTTNAIDAMPKGGVLKIAARLLPGKRGIEFTVADTGTGIPEADLFRIFNPFFTTKRPGKGTGLGLAIVSRIIENHQGSIRVESKLGKGSLFCGVLPLTDVSWEASKRSASYG